VSRYANVRVASRPNRPHIPSSSKNVKEQPKTKTIEQTPQGFIRTPSLQQTTKTHNQPSKVSLPLNPAEPTVRLGEAVFRRSRKQAQERNVILASIFCATLVLLTKTQAPRKRRGSLGWQISA
jgi:hypothetical protein